MEQLVEEFLSSRTVSKSLEINEPLQKAIFLLEKSDRVLREKIGENLEDIGEIVHWPALHVMYNKNYEYCSSVLRLFVQCHFASSEALCRTAVEGAINLAYVSQKDSMDRQISYFKSYLDTERRQNKTWRMSVELSSEAPAFKEAHYSKINAKEYSLSTYEIMLTDSLKASGVDFTDSNLKWPSIFDRFMALGKEVDYRTVYIALCSQAHNDAEDLLNDIQARVSNIPGMKEATEVEQYDFTLYLIFIMIGYQIEASISYLKLFDLSSGELAPLLNESKLYGSMVFEHIEIHVRQMLSVAKT